MENGAATMGIALAETVVVDFLVSQAKYVENAVKTVIVNLDGTAIMDYLRKVIFQEKYVLFPCLNNNAVIIAQIFHI